MALRACVRACARTLGNAGDTCMAGPPGALLIRDEPMPNDMQGLVDREVPTLSSMSAADGDDPVLDDADGLVDGTGGGECWYGGGPAPNHRNCISVPSPAATSLTSVCT